MSLPRLTALALGAAERAGALAFDIARRVLEPLLGDRAEDRYRVADDAAPRPAQPAPPPPARPRPQRPPAAGKPAQRPARAAPPPRPPEPAPAEPPHVDSEAVVVAESADPGAEDGAGAQVRVDEPWPGYAAQTAAQITERIEAEGAATLAVVRLYESAHRGRVTILRAVDRRLKTA